jgi:hypothetical protein
LLFAFVFNFLISIQIGQYFWVFGNLPVGLLFLFQLIKAHQLFMKEGPTAYLEATNPWEKIAWKILLLPSFVKFPLLLILCFPILIVIMSLLMLFGQKPDSFILAFTDTYKHGFSQLDHLCENAQCGGHFLCSVAANGHARLVQPIRYGERGGGKIICNRQLLIANAFEELMELHFPKMHRWLRHYYNKVGNIVHCYYSVFDNRYIADLIYILMKPLEILFLLILYLVDKRPENRIAQQYMNKYDRQIIHETTSPHTSF